MFERAKARIDVTTTAVLLAAAATAVVALETTGDPVGLSGGAIGTTSDGSGPALLVSVTVLTVVAAKWSVEVLRDLLDAFAKVIAISALVLLALHVATGFDAVAFLDATATRVWTAAEAHRAKVDAAL